MKTILLLGAGKSATVLIDYLLQTVAVNKWKLVIADADRDQVLLKTNHSPFAEAVALDVTNDEARGALIEKSHLVISMMPPALHFLVAKDCVEYRKHLLTASYLDPKIRSLEQEVKQKKLLFLCEMGLDPGIDHMSAMKILDGIRAQGGRLTSFKSHCGGLVAPESDTNPWHYKISWNPRNVVLAGKAGAEYKLDGAVIQKDYGEVFNNCEAVSIDGLGWLAFYANRDSLSYIPVYKAQTASTFMRTTLRYADYCKGWKAIVAAQLTDDSKPLDTKGLTFKKWSAGIEAFIDGDNRNLLSFLGLFDEEPVPANASTSADILQFLLETKWVMQPHDKDMIVMLHEIGFDNVDGQAQNVNSTLVVTGEDSLRTAMAKTVGLPLGIAATLILNGTIGLTGVHIPIQKEIYEPVLQELENHGIRFTEKYS